MPVRHDRQTTHIILIKVQFEYIFILIKVLFDYTFIKIMGGGICGGCDGAA